MKGRILTSVTIACILFGAVSSNAATVNAKSGKREDIQAAIDRAPANATVVIPQGQFNFKGPRINIDKNITISGSGKQGTVLKKNSALDWFFQVVTEGIFRLTNIVLDGGKGGGGVALRSKSMKFRVDNSTLKNFSTRAIETKGAVKGVIDNNHFQENDLTDIVVYGDNDISWNKPVKLGTNDAVFIEDNVFTHKTVTNSHSIGSNSGSKYVFRHNTINDGNQNTNPIDAHGNYYNGRGSRSYEIYGNKINSGHSYMGMFIRGGSGAIYNNEFKGNFTYPITLTNYRSFKENVKYPAPDQIKDLYVWHNRVNGKDDVPPHVDDQGKVSEHVKVNRDYFTKSRKGYKPYTYPHPMRG